MASLQQLSEWGFKRWYERQLIEAHAWLVSCFLCLILAVAGLEVAGDARQWGKVGAVLLAFAAAAAGWFSYRRYKALLDLAERLGEVATCPVCKRYAKFDIEHAIPEGDRLEMADVRIVVRCRQCQTRWTMPE